MFEIERERVREISFLSGHVGFLSFNLSLQLPQGLKRQNRRKTGTTFSRDSVSVLVSAPSLCIAHSRGRFRCGIETRSRGQVFRRAENRVKLHARFKRAIFS